MESTLTLLTWTAIGFFSLGLGGLVLVYAARSRFRKAERGEDQQISRRHPLRDALDGLLDAIGALF